MKQEYLRPTKASSKFKIISLEELQKILNSSDFTLIRENTPGFSGIILNGRNKYYYAFRLCNSSRVSNYYYWPVGYFLKGKYAIMPEAQSF